MKRRRLTRSRSKPGRPPAARKKPAKTPKLARSNRRVILMVGTRKGAFIYYGDATRSRWSLDGPSPNEGRNWNCVAAHLPHIYSVVAATLP